MERTKVLIVDGSTIVREGLRSMLQEIPTVEVVGEAKDASEALRKVDELGPDTVLAGPHMLTRENLEFFRINRPQYPAISIVIVSPYADDVLAIEAIQAGVTAFLPGDVTRQLLSHTIEAVRSGCSLVESSLLQRLVVAGIEPSPTARGKLAKPGAELTGLLTGRELEVLQRVVDGLSNKEIGVALGITEDTVKKHVQRILSKLHASDRTHAAVKALRAGLLD